jgi:hypothetical protein
MNGLLKSFREAGLAVSLAPDGKLSIKGLAALSEEQREHFLTLARENKEAIITELRQLITCPHVAGQYPVTDCAFCSKSFSRLPGWGCPIADEYREVIEAVPGRARDRTAMLVVIGAGDIVIRGANRPTGGFLQ